MRELSRYTSRTGKITEWITRNYTNSNLLIFFSGGAPYVISSGLYKMQMLCVDNLDMKVYSWGEGRCVPIREVSSFQRVLCTGFNVGT